MLYPTISEYVKANQDVSDNLDMSTEATDEELYEAITDEFGVKYSKDGRKLLKAPKKLDGIYSIRKGTKIICEEAFRWSKTIGCHFLKSLVIPDSVTNIGDYAFWGCTSLKSLVIPDSVTHIGNGAFNACSSLKSLVIPASVGNIIGNPFSGWNGELKCLSPCFIYDDKVLFDKDKSKIIAFRDKNTTSYVIPDSVTSIGYWAFQFCSSLNDIIIPDSVNSIGHGAFWGCNIPNDLKQELSSRFGDKIFGN